MCVCVCVGGGGGGGEGGGGRHKYPSTLQAGVHLKKGQKLIVKFGGGSLVLSPHLILFSQVLRWESSGGGGK